MIRNDQEFGSNLVRREVARAKSMFVGDGINDASMVLSIGGMSAAATGLLPPIYGAVAQEVIDLAAVLNALRVAIPRGRMADFGDRPASRAA